MNFDIISYVLGFVSPFVLLMIYAAIMWIIEWKDDSFEKSILSAFRRD